MRSVFMPARIVRVWSPKLTRTSPLVPGPNRMYPAEPINEYVAQQPPKANESTKIEWRRTCGSISAKMATHEGAQP